MKCPACGHANREGAHFCGECATPLAAERACPSCGRPNPAGQRFCDGCARPLVAAPAALPERPPRDYTPRHLAEKILQSKSALEGERKQVTVLFADVKGSMELSEALDPEEWHRILERFFEILTDGVHRFEGTVNQYTGDGIMALFGAPIAYEDHAQRACYAALWLREEIARYATEVKREQGLGFSVRMGVNSGDVVVGKIGDDLRMDYTAQGHTVGLAQRMEALASPDTCYLTSTTAALVGGYFELENLGDFQVKGVGAPVRIHRLVGPGAAHSRFDLVRARGLTRFVGREADMATLAAALEEARAGHGQVVGVVAEAGTGKSRLCFEFLERCRAQGVTLLEGHAVAHGKNVPYLPMLQVFRDYYGITEQDDDRSVRERIAGRLLLLDEAFRDALPTLFEFFGVADPDQPPPGLDPEAKQRQLFAVVRRIVQGADPRVGARHFVTLIEDLHWLDPGSEAFLEQWVDALAGSSGFLLVNFRPEYRAAWLQKSYYRQLPLAPLGPDAIRDLLDDLLGHDPSTSGLAEAIHERTGGNPFFIEELVQTLVESRHLEGRRGSYRLVTPIERLEVPGSVQAVLAARIDRLPERDKRVLQTAAVIGKEFAEPILLAVADLPDAELRAALAVLEAREFVYQTALYPVAAYAFKHPLTQEVALGSQLRERRRRTHAAVARAMEGAYADKLDEQAALLAHHFEEAGEPLAAARWHRRAAQWVGMSNVQAALQHWRRVRDLAQPGDTGTESLSLALAARSQMLALGWRTGASEEECARLFEEGCSLAQRAGDLVSLASLTANYAAIRGVSAGSANDYVRYAGEAAHIAERTGDAALLCGVLGYEISACWLWGRPDLAPFERLLELSGGDPHLGAHIAGFSPLIQVRSLRAASFGSTRDAGVAARELPALRQLALDCGYPEMAVWVLAVQAMLASVLADGEGAEARAREALRLAENQSGNTEIFALFVLGSFHALQGDWAALLDTARGAIRRMEQTRTGRVFQALVLDQIAVAELGLGHLDDGRRAAAEAVAFISRSGTRFYPRAYATLARAQLLLGVPAAEVERTLAAYAALFEETGLRLFEPELHEVRALLAAREGNREQQVAALRRAHELYSSLGMTAHADRLARELGP